MKNLLNPFTLLFVALMFFACNDEKSYETESGEALVAVRLTDAPGDYDAVNIEVENVEIKYNGTTDDDNDTNIVVLDNFNAGVYNLLELTGGVSVLLTEDEIPSGEVNQIRLILGDDNTVEIDGDLFPLSTPSAQQSGLKIQLNETLENDVFYEFLLDFDVDRSIVQQGNGGYLLKPTIRASLTEESGQIIGTVLPLGIQVLATATNGGIEVSSFTNEQGEFVIAGIPSGTYTLSIEADPDAALDPVIIENVEVINEEITDVGIIDLE